LIAKNHQYGKEKEGLWKIILSFTIRKSQLQDKKSKAKTLEGGFWKNYVA